LGCIAALGLVVDVLGTDIPADLGAESPQLVVDLEGGPTLGFRLDRLL
jgi:hypothetical protein